MVGGGDPFYLKFWVNRPRVEAKSLLAPQPYDLAKEVQLTLTRSPYALFSEPKMIIVRCPKSPKGGSKTQNGRFPSKIELRLKKLSLLQSFFSVKTVSDKVV